MGTEWGDSGYFWMSYQATADTRIVYGYACYVTDRIDYQPVLIGTVRFNHATRDRVGIRFGIGTPERSLWQQDFRSWRAAVTDHPFPSRRIPFDLTDGAPWLTGEEDTLYLACLDDTADGRTGSVELFEVKHLGWQTQGTSTEMPLAIPDNGDTVAATLLLPFAGVSEPQAGRTRPECSTFTVVRGALFVPAARSERREARSELLDAAGRKVLELRPGTNDVSRLVTGVYFATRGGQVIARTVVVH
jgi:hypothetical protein